VGGVGSYPLLSQASTPVEESQLAGVAELDKYFGGHTKRGTSDTHTRSGWYRADSSFILRSPRREGPSVLEDWAYSPRGGLNRETQTYFFEI
jgi:hypothetical protein